MEIDARALSRDVAGGAVDLPANTVLAVLTQGAAVLVEGAEAVRWVVGVPETFTGVDFILRTFSFPLLLDCSAWPCLGPS